MEDNEHTRGNNTILSNMRETWLIERTQKEVVLDQYEAFRAEKNKC